MRNDISILDCTLRDGGYYNNWDFDPALTDAYLGAVARAKIDVVEIGFRFTPKQEFLGPYAYTTDDHLRNLDLPAGPDYAVMVNAGDLVKYPDGPVAAVDALFDNAENSPVDMIRVATHFREAEQTLPALKRMAELGYRVGFNLMQISRENEMSIADTVRKAQTLGCIEVLYFADSLGNMRPADIRRVIGVMAAEWKGPLGIHAHNNMQNALLNTMEAADAGAQWLDATVLGMGRGAGNAQTELLLMEVQDKLPDKYDADAVIPLAMGAFRELQIKYGWGADALYYMSAKNGIHPTYVQTMYSDLKIAPERVVSALRALTGLEGHSFRAAQIAEALSEDLAAADGAWNPQGWLDGQDVLLLGPGPSVQRHASALQSFIRKHKPAVLNLNMGGAVPADLITAYVACHPTRILTDGAEYSSLGCPLILPAQLVAASDLTNLEHIDHMDFGIEQSDSGFDLMGTYCRVPKIQVAAYALAVATGAGARRILLAGFDGFEPFDARHQETLEIFEAYADWDQSVPLRAITPTRYPIPAGSVYAPEV